MRWWPSNRNSKLRFRFLLGLLIAVVAFAGYRLKQRYGWGGGKLDPVVRGTMPENTPLPRPSEEPHPPRMRSEWKSMAVSKSRSARQALWLTAEVAASELVPLVVVLHGDGGTARTFHEQFRYEEASGTWATVVYPDGLRSTWDTASQRDNPDVLFLDALLDEAVRTRQVDPSRIFLTGYSSGGFLAQLYACQRSNEVRAIATHEAGAPYNQRERWPNGSPKCPGQSAVATLVTHGREDFSVGFQSGLYSAFYWGQVNGCDVRNAAPTGYPECYAYERCEPGKPVVFCDIPGLGHWVWSEGAAASVRFFQRLSE